MSSNSQLKMSSNSQLKNHQLDQIAPIGFKFRAETLYDRNIWRGIIQMNQFNPETQWKFIIDLQITELYDQLSVDSDVLEYLCLKNHRQLIELLIKKDSQKKLNWDYGLQGACQGGHRDLIQWMIECGAEFWSWGLEGACQGGHQELAQWMIDLGSKDWNEGLFGACRGGHKELAQWMIDLGANNWNWGLEGACEGGFKDLAQWMIDLGANNWNRGLSGACEEGFKELAQMMLNLGANDVWIFNHYFPNHQ